MEAIVLAGGFGTRLAAVVKDVPKPMAPVCGRPFLKYLLDYLVDEGVDRVVLAVGYKKEVIIDHFGDRYKGAEIVYSVEDTPLNTGGAAKKAAALCREERAFVFNGDTYFPADLKKLRAAAAARDRATAIAVKHMVNFSRYGAVVFDSEHRVLALREKQQCRDGYISGGIYDFYLPSLAAFPEVFSMETDCFPRLIGEGKLVACPDDADFIDMGIPEDYERIQKLFEEKHL